ncbi:NUDIX domain-containing protein [Pseudonocardia alaniniphila]|uniref:NUDIX domain-containing protein n=1 Tax=Pseudonocardia alaniniphila TaxID=75291 RepID=A0ABS9TN20_9PSEU|nr:NUDIX domain-containing protein [Pseudonocardia alaniniphila]MCH6169908.1 NUDIX domain-containing protein [Pseudonocardia alaniniphila]
MTEMDVGSEFTWDDQVAVRSVHFHDPAAPAATTVTPSVFVAVHDEQGRFLLVQRRDSGAWEFPGGRMDVGETAMAAAVRETAEEAGVRVRITGLVGLFSDPAFVIRAVDGRIRQPFVVCFHAVAEWGSPRPDEIETSDAGWFEPEQIETMTLEPGACRWIHHAIAGSGEPHLE